MSKHTRFKKVALHKLSRRNPYLLRLWTFQPIEVWRQLEAKGHLFVDPAYTDPFFSISYRWMRKQMQRRIPGYEGHSPWWAYPLQPDLRSYYCNFPNAEGEEVCLELQMDASRVLISDYYTWHLVMSRSFIPLSRAEDEETDEFQWTQSENIKRQIRRSWERIFDLEALQASDIWSTDYLQACFERLDIQDVVTVTELRRRN